MGSGVYAITNTLNGHRYIGSSVSLRRRRTLHQRCLCRGVHHSGHLQNAFDKYGEGAFVFEVLEECEPEFLVSTEQWWMNMLRPEYNICQVAGNCLGRNPSPEHRANLSAAGKGHRHTAEARARISAVQKGHVTTAEHRANIGAALKGRVKTPEHQAKISAALKGRKRSAETRARMSEAQVMRRAAERLVV